MTDPFGLCPTRAEVYKNRALKWLHTALDFGGIFFDGFDFVNVLLYHFEGRDTETAITLLCLIPGMGNFLALPVRLTLKLGDNAGEALIKLGKKYLPDLMEKGSRFLDWAGGKVDDVWRWIEKKLGKAGAESGSSSIPTQGQMHDAVTQWARMEESLANSKTQLSKFNTASVVYDSATGNYFYGMNRGIQLSGDNLNSSLKSWLPEKSLNDYKLGNCAEVDAINQALNSGADVNGLYMYTINTKTNLPKPMCENCSYTFWGRVADVFSH